MVLQKKLTLMICAEWNLNSSNRLRGHIQADETYNDDFVDSDFMYAKLLRLW